MKNKTRILVTHALDCIPKCDWIILLKKGCVEFDGNYNELVSTDYFNKIKNSLDTSHFEEEEEKDNQDEEKSTTASSLSKSYLSQKEKLINTKESDE